MDWHDYLRRKRTDYLRDIELLEAGRIGTHEMRDRRLVDTTDKSIERCRANVAEIERILAKAGVRLDA